MNKINKGQSVKVMRKGMFENMIGKVVSVNYQVDFGNLGIWSFKSDEVIQDGVIPELKEIEPPEPLKLSESADITEEQPAKRPYAKKAKDKPAKEKRKYSPRKPKTV